MIWAVTALNAVLCAISVTFFVLNRKIRVRREKDIQAINIARAGDAMARAILIAMRIHANTVDRWEFRP